MEICRGGISGGYFGEIAKGWVISRGIVQVWEIFHGGWNFWGLGIFSGKCPGKYPSGHYLGECLGEIAGSPCNITSLYVAVIIWATLVKTHTHTHTHTHVYIVRQFSTEPSQMS